MKRYEEIMMLMIEYIHATGTHDGDAGECIGWPCDLLLYSADDDLERQVKDWDFQRAESWGAP